MPKKPFTPEEIAAQRERIMDSASHVMAEVGFHHLSMRKLASQLGMTASNIYNYFPNKESLFVHTRRRGFDLSGLGPLDIELDLCLPSVSATFWSERSDTLASLNQALQPLRQTLTELGADVGELKARHGQKPASDQPVVRHSLVDLHT